MEIPLCAATVIDRNFLLNYLLQLPEQGSEGVFVVRLETSAPERITDFSAGLYLNGESKRPLENIEQVEEDLWTWWAEADLRPSPIRLFVHDNGLKDKYGNDLLSQSQAAAIIRKGRVEQDRVEAEVAGVKQLRDLLLSRGATDGVIYLSPPGSAKEGFGAEGRRRLSFTYLYHMGNAGRIHFLAVPELEISILEQFNRVSNLVDHGATAAVVGVGIGELNDRSLVAYPFLAADSNSLDQLSQKLGYNNLLDLWKQALEAKRLRGRVGEVIKHTSQEIWDAHQQGDKLKLEVLSDVFRGVVALMTGTGLDDVDNPVDYFDDKVHAIVSAKKIDRFVGTTHRSYVPFLSQIQEFQMRMNNNPYAQEVTNGGSCPTGDKGLGLDIFGGRNSYIPNNVMSDVLGIGMEFSGSFGGPEAVKSGRSITITLQGGITYTLEVKAGEHCINCSRVSGYDPELLIGPCKLCEHCDPNVHKAD